MAFLASLVAYLITVGGIVAAFLMAYSALLATPPDQPPIAPHKVETTLKLGTPPTADETAATEPAIQAGRRGPRVAPRVTEDAALPQTKTTAFAGRKTVAANETARHRHAPPDLRPRPPQWAYQQQPDVDDSTLGYAEQRANRYDRIW